MIRKEFDTRVVNFHLRTGNVTPEEFQAHLDALPDDAKEAVEVQVKFENTWERRQDEDED